MKVAVVGAGGIGSLHARLLAELGHEVLVVDIDAGRAAGVASRIGARAVAFETAVDEADAVVVATPADLHAEPVRRALAAGRSVLCEKPLAEDLRESVALAELGGHLEVGFQRRHDPSFVAAREAAAGSRIHLVRLAAFDPAGDHREPSSWPMRDAAPIFLHSSVHDFDFVRWLTGQEVVSVMTDASGRDEARPSDPRAIETATVQMRLSRGALAVLEATWLHPGGYDIRVEVLTDREHLTTGLSTRTPARHLDWVVTDAIDSRAAWTGYLDRFETAYRNELVAFLAAARGEQAPATTGTDGVEALRIAIAATRSYLERRPVAPAEIEAAAPA
ncbi:MAG: Gfo/Idh/MocA family oxidoreductase [Chloroflexota bacterium]|nr:Gfo/Idh/MocA family oxidoreductase [Chloroflexota bacterium]